MSKHDRLDLKLNVLAFTDSPCGSLDLATGEAAYCGFDCPTLKRRMLADENPAVPLNTIEEGVKFDPRDPRT